MRFLHRLDGAKTALCGIAGLGRIHTRLEVVLDLHFEVSADFILELAFKAPVPDRRVVLAWRKSFTRLPAIEALRAAVLKCPLQGVTKLDLPAAAQ